MMVVLQLIKLLILKDEKHITKTTAGNEYTVDNNGNVTMTYTDGEGNLVTGETAVIKGIAKTIFPTSLMMVRK